uniref:Uncharacterized protein n=1 Tax=Anguilla anguilla TaxID=7936 RepID=A0A0E9R2Q4_ANGAN
MLPNAPLQNVCLFIHLFIYCNEREGLLVFFFFGSDIGQGDACFAIKV